jgi:hypothetical protein
MITIKDRCMTAICKQNGELVLLVPLGAMEADDFKLVYMHRDGTECVHGVTT